MYIHDFITTVHDENNFGTWTKCENNTEWYNEETLTRKYLGFIYKKGH